MYKLSEKELFAKKTFDFIIEKVRVEPSLFITNFETYEPVADFLRGIEIGIEASCGVLWLDGFREWVAMQLGSHTSWPWHELLFYTQFLLVSDKMLPEVFELYDSFTIARERMSTNEIKEKWERRDFKKRAPFACDKHGYSINR